MESKKDFCSCNVIHQDKIDLVSQSMLPDNIIDDMAEFYKVFGDGTRVKILNALLCEEMCVCDLSHLLSMNQSAISHQLRVLKQARLVKNRKDGKVVYYSLNDDHIRGIFNQALEHVKE